MNIRTLFSDIQMTTLLVILFQILSSTHMFPISSPSRKSELDLLLDPVYQAEQDVQETKRVVTKSVYNTVIRVPQEQGCPQDMQRVKANGPCVTRYESPTGPLFDDSYRLAALKDLQRQGAFSNTNRRKRPNNRHRGTTTPRVTTTTNLPVETSTLQELGHILPTLPSKLNGSDTVEPSSGESIRPETNVTRIEKRPISPVVITDFQIEHVKAAEIEINFSTTIPSPIAEISPPEPNRPDENLMSTAAPLRNDDVLTTIKADLHFIPAQNESLTGEKGAQVIGGNVKFTLGDRVTIPQNSSENSIIFINNSTEDPGVSFYNQDEESYTTPFTPQDYLSSSLSIAILLPGEDSSTVKLEDTDDPSAAAISSSSSSPQTLGLSDPNPKGFNYARIRSDNLMTDVSTQVVLDVEELDRMNLQQQTSNTSAIANSSEIDFTTTPSSLQTPVDSVEHRVMAEIESGDEVKIEMDPSETPSTTPPSLDYDPEESLRTINIPKASEPFKSEEPHQFQPTRLPTPISSLDNTRLSTEDVGSSLSSEIELLSPNEGELDRIHHRSRTRNRIKNPDFSENQQEPLQDFFHQGRVSHRDELSRTLQSQSHAFINPSTEMGLSFRYPQHLGSSIDYLKLGENYPRFRVF